METQDVKKSDAWNQDQSKMMMQPFRLTGGDKDSHDENIAADCTTVFCYSDSRCVYIQWFISQNWHMKHCMCGSILIHTPQLFFTWLKMDKLIVIVILQLTEPPTSQEWSFVNPVSLEPYFCFEAGRDSWGMILIWSLIIIQIVFPWSHSELFSFWIRHGN